MTAHISKDPLHGVTLEMMVNATVAKYGWSELGDRIKINCFRKDPSVKSSLKFLRRTRGRRAEVEALYLDSLSDGEIQSRRRPPLIPGLTVGLSRANTQMTRHVKRIGALAACALLLASCSSKTTQIAGYPLPTVSKPTPQANAPMRGIWLATVSRVLTAGRRWPR